MWLRLSNVVSDEVLFWLAIILWFVPFCGANELVFWYAYNVHEKKTLFNKYRKVLPRKMIASYLDARSDVRGFVRESIEEQRSFELLTISQC